MSIIAPMNQENQWRLEQYKNYWHPLFKYVEDFCTFYEFAVYDVDKKLCEGWKDMTLEEQCAYSLGHNHSYLNDFNDAINFLQECFNGTYPSRFYKNPDVEGLLKIFRPLHIVNYKNFVLFKYKNFIELSDMGYGSDFFDLYGGLYRECRSVVIDLESMELALAPQKKFFNINENSENEQDKIIKMVEKAKKVEFSDKLDGSNENFRWSTKLNKIIGSSASALDRTESWRLDEGYKYIEANSGYTNMMKAYPDYTFMFEYISPKNQVVVYYPPEKAGLYLFGMRNIKTGEEKTYEEVISIGKNFGVPTTEIFDTNLNELFNSLDDYKANDKEGWVIRIIKENGELFKAKLKINDYVLMHRAISKIISPNTVIQSICDNKYDDFLSKVPVSFRESVEQIKDKVSFYNSLMNKKLKEYIELAKKDGVYTGDAKIFVEWCNQNVSKIFVPFCIAVYKNKFYDFIQSRNGKRLKLYEIEDRIKSIQNL